MTAAVDTPRRRVVNLNRHLKQLGPIEPGDLQHALDVWTDWRLEHGRGPRAPLLGPPAGNAKLKRSETPTYGLSLAPANRSSRYNTCTWSTPQCRKACLVTAGRNPMPAAAESQTLKTMFLAKHPQEFVTILRHEIVQAQKQHGSVLVRLNLLSDLEWEVFAPSLLQVVGVFFYDYTKSWKRATESDRELPPNYRLVLSASDKLADGMVHVALDEGHSVAMIFDELPEVWQGRTVFDGDEHDNRWLEPPGSLIGLRAKGAARNLEPSRRGMVRPIASAALPRVA